MADHQWCRLQSRSHASCWEEAAHSLGLFFSSAQIYPAWSQATVQTNPQLTPAHPDEQRRREAASGVCSVSDLVQEETVDHQEEM